MEDFNKNLRKTIVFCAFCELLFEKQKYEEYSLNNIYGGFRLQEEIEKMHKRDKSVLENFMERLDCLYE